MIIITITMSIRFPLAQPLFRLRKAWKHLVEKCACLLGKCAFLEGVRASLARSLARLCAFLARSLTTKRPQFRIFGGCAKEERGGPVSQGNWSD